MILSLNDATALEKSRAELLNKHIFEVFLLKNFCDQLAIRIGSQYHEDPSALTITLQLPEQKQNNFQLDTRLKK